jgi:hypothetical protein
MEKAPLPNMEKAPFRPQTRAGGGAEKFGTCRKGAFSGASCATAPTSGTTALLARVSYDALSRRQSVTYRNGTAASYAYSAAGDLSDHDWTKPDGGSSGPLVGFDFAYNPVGQQA